MIATEMVTANALIQGHRLDLLDFDKAENPLALQLGGSDPKILAECDTIVDVGGVFDPQQRRFDHHQKYDSFLKHIILM